MHANIHKLLLILLLTAFPMAMPLTGKIQGRFTLVIDAGHGGKDAGAIGKFSKEKDINLSVALAFGKLVETNCPDVKVIYTRKNDIFIPLQRRADIANENKADLFISIHTNALPNGRIAYGAETYSLGMHRAADNLEVAKRENSVIALESDYKTTYEGFDPNKAESYVIFELMQDRFMEQSVDLSRFIQNQYKQTGRQDKGVHQAGFLVLRNTMMPSVLTELGFISTPEEENFLNTTQGVEKMSRSIYNGFLNYRRKYDKAANDLPDNLPNAGTTQTATNPTITTITTETSHTATPQSITTNNVEYRIQVGAGTKEVSTKDSQFKGIEITRVKEGTLYKYQHGSFVKYSDANDALTNVKAKIPGAYIVAYVNGSPAAVTDARKKE